ncbi:Basic helix-loop-helix DNA-binding superfamily protein [Hibiscus syriacus]|uniref:Basic helix-loop-helix DNA-binding superfamily protein n=1 Tax=Hibiscus syriacus TaxID=106335 RepID=A0A6A2X3J9_HIBSY|nr:Basic helix-loop-helix DNA-binding superfamily protein [Hibiscus syriacus]
MNVVIASSSIDDDIGYWDLQTGAEQLRYKTCASPPHGLASIDSRFLACSQLHDPSGHVLYWSWSKPQAQVKSFPVEHIKPLAANSLGSYIVGGGSSDDIYFWEVATGRSEKIKELGLEGKQRDEYYAWGLHEVAKAVSFLNNDCKPVQGKKKVTDPESHFEDYEKKVTDPESPFKDYENKMEQAQQRVKEGDAVIRDFFGGKQLVTCTV